MKSKYKYQLIASVAALLLNTLCTAIVFIFGIETTALKIIGSFASIIIVSAVAWMFPLRFYMLAMGFVFFAASLGSCVNLYRHVGFYDLFVHYLSGVLLAEGGRIIIDFVCKKRKLPDDGIVKNLFALFFSCACAGFWEIYEFTADCLINADMQGSKVNTMGDIIAGVLGAVTYFAVSMLLKKKSKT